MMPRITWIFLVLLPLFSFSQWPKGLTYEIFVQSFYDTDGDGIGDINGVTEKLPYLEDLGVEAIWLMPIHPSPSYHKYDVVDYYGIHPDYGTMEDFKRFVSEAHKRGIKVVIDLVINHSSEKHPWFQEASKGPENPYRQYYVWRDYKEVKEEISKKTITLDSDNITQWHKNGKDKERFYGFFWGGMPDLNFDYQPLREEIYQVGRFWLKDVGVDGFRLDAARHIFPDDRPEDNHAFWEEFRNEMKKVNPDVYLVGEVWAEAEEVAPYLNGLPALFNFDIGISITKAVQSGEESGLVSQHKKIQDFYSAVNPDFVDATIITNHDQNRIMSLVGGNIDKAKMAASLLFTLPGSPYMYYGEEIGMKGLKPDEQIREPFIWNEFGKDKGQCTWIKLKHNVQDSTASLAQQIQDSNSILSHYKKLIQFRKQHPTLQLGILETLDEVPDGLVAFLRSHEDERLMVVHNLSHKTKSYSPPSAAELIETFGQKTISFEEGKLTLPPYSSAILRKR